MRSKFLLGLVVVMLMAAPAMASPMIFTFSGSAGGSIDAAMADFDFIFKLTADTTNLLQGTFNPTGATTAYYGNLSATFSYIDYNAAVPTWVYDVPIYAVPTNAAMPGTFYVAATHGSVGLGAWDPALFSSAAPIGDLVSMANPFGSVALTTTQTIVDSLFYQLGGAFFTLNDPTFLTGPFVEISQSIQIGEIPNPDYVPGVPDTGPQFLPVYAPMTFTSTAVPEPAMFLLFGAGLLGFGVLRKKM